MQNCSRISFYEWINHIPKRQFTLTFNILQAFSDDSDKALFQAMPLSQIIVLCFSVTLWRNGTPGLEKQLITWIVAGKWTMTEERDWISIGLQHWLPFYFKMLPVLPRFVSPLSSKHVHFIAQLIFLCLSHTQIHRDVHLVCMKPPVDWVGESCFWVTEKQNSETGVNWGLDPIISLSAEVFVGGWVRPWF